MKDFFPGIFTSQSLSVDNDKASWGRAIQGLRQKSSYTRLETEIEPYWTWGKNQAIYEMDGLWQRADLGWDKLNLLISYPTITFQTTWECSRRTPKAVIIEFHGFDSSKACLSRPSAGVVKSLWGSVRSLWLKIEGRSRKFSTQCLELIFLYPTALLLDLICFIGIRHIGQRMWVQ